MNIAKRKNTRFSRRIAALLSAAIFVFSVNAYATQKAQYMWINAEQKAELKDKFHLNYLPIRFQYTKLNNGSEWLLKEYGKEQLIDYKVRINDGVISSIQVITYREPYGGEIKQSRFLKQFVGANLKQQKGAYALTKRIDGISGATISVKSTIRIAGLALYLDSKLKK